MTEVISVRFKNRGKVYFFDPNGTRVEHGDKIVVETSKGLELGECAKGNHFVQDEKIIPPLRPVIRIATRNDLHSYENNKQKETEAHEICRKKIAEHGLDMKLVDVEYNFEGNKILFFFTADGRVDFRELVKDLASVFRMRIELRQIGVRDEARMLGGLGLCGRQFCCSQFLDDFQPVSTKMAKTQSMSLNPTKISGSCGRLMCCLRYEHEAYEDLIKSVPKSGTFVETPAGYGNVTQVNLLRRSLKVRIDGESDPGVRTYGADEIAVVPGGRPKEGESLPPTLLKKVVPIVEERDSEGTEERRSTPDRQNNAAQNAGRRTRKTTQKRRADNNARPSNNAGAATGYNNAGASTGSKPSNTAGVSNNARPANNTRTSNNARTQNNAKQSNSPKPQNNPKPSNNAGSAAKPDNKARRFNRNTNRNKKPGE